MRHKKSILTITYSGIYDEEKTPNDTSTETRPRHDRDTNEERKEREDLDNTIDGAEAHDPNLLKKGEKWKIRK